MWRKTGQTMLCGGRRRRHGCWKPTGRWTSTASRLTPGCSSHHSTSFCASSCPTWSTWRSRSTSQTASSRLCRTSAKHSVSGMEDSFTGEQAELRSYLHTYLHTAVMLKAVVKKMGDVVWLAKRYGNSGWWVQSFWRSPSCSTKNFPV